MAPFVSFECSVCCTVSCGKTYPLFKFYSENHEKIPNEFRERFLPFYRDFHSKASIAKRLLSALSHILASFQNTVQYSNLKAFMSKVVPISVHSSI